MDETNFIDKKALKHFEKQLASRDKYVKENGDYIETKRDKIGLSSSEILAGLGFVISNKPSSSLRAYQVVLSYSFGDLPCFISKPLLPIILLIDCIEKQTDTIKSDMVSWRIILISSF